MKLRAEHVKTFTKQLQELHEEIPALARACKEWAQQQDYRAEGYNPDQEWLAYQRAGLEKRLTKFRAHLGDIYDFMSEKGMRDVPASTPTKPTPTRRDW